MKTLAIVVLGNKLKKNGLDKEVTQRCELAVEEAQRFRDKDNSSQVVVVLSGGETVAGLPAEATVAEPYLARLLSAKAVHDVVVLLETSAKTTAENILFSQELLRAKEYVLDELVIIGRASQIPKCHPIVWWLWDLGKPRVRYSKGIDTSPVLVQWFDRTAMLVLHAIDPEGHSLYPLKKLCRNG